MSRFRRPVLAALVLVVTATACGSASSSSAQHQPTSSTTRPAPPSTATTTSSVPVNEGQPSAVDPQHIQEISFVSLRDGFGLDGGDVVTTVDGGISWGTVATAGQTELPSATDDSEPKGIVFTTTKDGFIWNADDEGPSLSITTDGGRTWLLVQSPTDVTAVLPEGSSVWAVTGSPASGKIVQPRLWESPDGGQTWSSSPEPLPGDGVYISSATRVNADTAYVVDRNTSGTAALVETTDAGRSWLTRSLPSDLCGRFGVLVQAADPSDPWLACAGQPSAGSQDHAIYRSSDSGQTWRVVASNVEGQPAVGALPGLGYLDQFAVASDTTAYIALGRGPLIETADGGTTWKAAASNYDTGAFDPVLAPPINATTSVALVSGQSWSTTNGTTWTPTT